MLKKYSQAYFKRVMDNFDKSPYELQMLIREQGDIEANRLMNTLSSKELWAEVRRIERDQSKPKSRVRALYVHSHGHGDAVTKAATISAI